MDETLVLKARLREVISANKDKALLEDLEDFHTKLIDEDALIMLLRSDIAELDNILEQRKTDNGSKAKINRMILDRLEKLRNNILLTENQFSFLKLEFNCYIFERLN